MGELLKTKSFWVGVTKIVVALLVGFLGLTGIDVQLDPEQQTILNVLSQIVSMGLAFWGADTITRRHTELKKERILREIREE